MRFLLVLAIWLVIVGGLYQYIAWRDRAANVPAAGVAAVQISSGEITLEITPTFSLEEDPFALKSGEGGDTSLEIRLNGKLLAVSPADLQRGRPFAIAAANGILVGRNEIHVKASPPVAEGSLDHALRVRVIERDAVLTDHSLWSSGGAVISGAVGFDIREKEAGHDH